MRNPFKKKYAIVAYNDAGYRKIMREFYTFTGAYASIREYHKVSNWFTFLGEAQIKYRVDPL